MQLLWKMRIDKLLRVLYVILFYLVIYGNAQCTPSCTALSKECQSNSGGQAYYRCKLYSCYHDFMSSIQLIWLVETLYIFTSYKYNIWTGEGAWLYIFSTSIFLYLTVPTPVMHTPYHPLLVLVLLWNHACLKKWTLLAYCNECVD